MYRFWYAVCGMLTAKEKGRHDDEKSRQQPASETNPDPKAHYHGTTPLHGANGRIGALELSVGGSGQRHAKELYGFGGDAFRTDVLPCLPGKSGRMAKAAGRQVLCDV